MEKISRRQCIYFLLAGLVTATGCAGGGGNGPRPPQTPVSVSKITFAASGDGTVEENLKAADPSCQFISIDQRSLVTRFELNGEYVDATDSSLQALIYTANGIVECDPSDPTGTGTADDSVSGFFVTKGTIITVMQAYTEELPTGSLPTAPISA